MAKILQRRLAKFTNCIKKCSISSSLSALIQLMAVQRRLNTTSLTIISKDIAMQSSSFVQIDAQKHSNFLLPIYRSILTRTVQKNACHVLNASR